MIAKRGGIYAYTLIVAAIGFLAAGVWLATMGKYLQSLLSIVIGFVLLSGGLSIIREMMVYLRET